MEFTYYACISFVIEFIKVLLFSYFFFNLKLKNRVNGLIAMGICFVILVGIVVYPYGFKMQFLNGLISAVILAFLSNKRKFKILYYLLSYMLISISDMIISSVVVFTFSIKRHPYTMQTLLLNCITLVILFLCSCIKAKKKISFKELKMDVKIIVLFMILAVSIGGYITGLHAIVLKSGSGRVEQFCVMFLTLSIVVSIVICIMLIVSDTKNEQLKENNKLNIRLLSSQKDYYTMLLKKDTDARNFRHDFNNHILCMSVLLKNKEYDKLSDYFNKVKSKNEILRPAFSTGNNLFDAILYDQYSRHKEVSVFVKGSFPSDIKCSEMDLCTIFSNLLSNGFEAAELSQEKLITIVIKILSSTICVEIINSCDSEPICENNIPVTTKQDDGHGLGISNIITCVNKINGNFKYEYKDNYFTAQVILPDTVKI